ncbi:MAG: PDZ domain-containing protein [Haliscomenobacteraceae bacterium CHB4]|nr:PDZ domain-containing protein [Haliscomenobacteraceae bacterium CHB4]
MKKHLFAILLTTAVFCSAAFLLLTAFEVEPDTAKPLTIPFQYRGHILLKANINGKHTANLLLDSGADGLLLDEQYFNSTGIVIERSQQAQLPGAGAEPQIITVVLDRISVRLDTITFLPRYVPLMDLRSIVGEKADGVIGIEFTRPYLTEIDFEREEMTLHPDNSVLAGFDSIRLEVRNNRYYLPVAIEAADGLVIQGKFQLDLGNGGTLVLNSPIAQKYDLDLKIQKKMKYFNVSGGAGGRVEGYQFRAKSLTLGNVILERFRVMIDFGKGILYLKPGTNLSEPFISNISGMSVVNKSSTIKAVLVTGLYAGGNAEKAGLQVGDRIVSVDGKKVTTLDEKQMDALLRQPGNPLELIYIRDGEEKKTSLQRTETL